MINEKMELDIDPIGNQDGLTEKEEKELKNYFKKRKFTSSKRQRKVKPKTTR